MTRFRTYVYPFIILAFLIAGSVQVNAQSTAWNLTITGIDQNGNQLGVELGTEAGATNGFDAGLDQYAPPAPPNGSFDIRITADGEDYFKFFRPLTTTTASWNLSARPSTGGGTEQVTLTWDNTGLGSTDFYLLEYQSGSGTEQIDLTEQAELVLPAGQQNVTVIHVVQEAVTISYTEGWQQVGYPAEGTNVDPSEIFANEIAGTFFSHNLSYTEETVFTPGVGNWIRLSGAETVSIEPPFLTEVTLSLQPGWYLISGPGTSVAFADINDPGSILVAGSLKAYDNVNGYVDASTLEPGRGYWVQADATGTITISSDVTASATKRVAKQLAEPEGFASFRISTNERDTPKFYLGGSLNEDGDLNPLSFSMPPLPPGDAFDVRFDNDSRLVNGNSGTLLVRSPGDSLTISHTNQTNDELEFSFTREGSVEVENYEIIPDQSLTISSEGISEINVQVGMASSVDDNVEKPNRIELSQNFPNPFNPSTVISYTLPEAGSVSLEVFDMTGRRIAVLAQGNQAAGAYTYDFDASSLSSGVYMYRLQSAGTVLTRKMTLIK